LGQSVDFSRHCAPLAFFPKNETSFNLNDLPNRLLAVQRHCVAGHAIRAVAKNLLCHRRRPKLRGIDGRLNAIWRIGVAVHDSVIVRGEFAKVIA
jgi:hypothetical protein